MLAHAFNWLELGRARDLWAQTSNETEAASSIALSPEIAAPDSD